MKMLLLLCAVGLVACGKDTPTPPSPVLVGKIVFTKAEYTVEMQHTLSLVDSITITPAEAENKKVQWSVDETDLAAIDKETGMFTPVASGVVTVTVTAVDAGGVKASCQVTITAPLVPARPRLPFDYVAAFNITPEKTFATTHHNGASGWFTWEDAKAACPQGYHIPSREEWCGIFSCTTRVTKYDGKSSKRDAFEQITIGNLKATYSADYQSDVDGIGYALKLKKGVKDHEKEGFPAAKDNSLLTAYRYERIGNFTVGDETSHIKITMRYLGEKFEGDIMTVSTEDFWKSNAEEDMVLLFDLCGKNTSGAISNKGTVGVYWMSTTKNTTTADVASFNKTIINASSQKMETLQNLRVFRDAE